MSGILALVAPNAAPVQPMMHCLSQAMACRGPHTTSAWYAGFVGLGHARPSNARSGPSPAIASVGQLWITADARIDDWQSLARAVGVPPTDTFSDAELILHAYAKWGDDCPRHFIGDFAFAIWDARQQRLFCARDHVGVKPLYYAEIAGGIVVSNTLQCIRRHPAVSPEINDDAIADFLLFGANQDPSATSFRDIKRVAPAHRLRWSDSGTAVTRYWTMGGRPPLRYRARADYVDHFKQVLRDAVSDRLHRAGTAILMSGGLDSTALAATASEILGGMGGDRPLHAFTVSYERLVESNERHYAELAARALNIPIHHLTADDYRPYETFHSGVADPSHSPLAAVFRDQLAIAAARCPVVLTGYGPDALFMYPMHAHVRRLLRRGRFDRVAVDLAAYLRAHRPFGLRRLTSRGRHLVRRAPQRGVSYPRWIDHDFEQRFDLSRRWSAAVQGAAFGRVTRQSALETVGGWYWATVFEKCDAATTGVSVEVRHPFFDLRVLEFCAALPPVPWCINKYLLRTALRGVLPDDVRLRPKAPLAADPLVAAVRRDGSRAVPPLTISDTLQRYVDVARLEPITGAEDPSELWQKMRPHTLGRWLATATAQPREPQEAA